jgi:16S rRNA (uracil1498-N3)-methyltransferase
MKASYHKRVPRLYVTEKLSLQKEIFLSADQCHHLLTVLRKKIGEHVLLFNGRDGEWLAALRQEHKKQFSAICLEQLKPQHEMVSIWLGFSLLKKHRQDFLIEKATELGVTQFIPVEMERTNLHSFNKEKVSKQGIEAAEQSERLSIPTVEDLVNLEKWLVHWPKDRLLYVALERAPHLSQLINTIEKDEKVGFLVGPEGGFSEKERELLAQYAFVRFFSFGSLILRAETAAILCVGLYNQLRQK